MVLSCEEVISNVCQLSTPIRGLNSVRLAKPGEKDLVSAGTFPINFTWYQKF